VEETEDSWGRIEAVADKKGSSLVVVVDKVVVVGVVVDREDSWEDIDYREDFLLLMDIEDWVVVDIEVEFVLDDDEDDDALEMTEAVVVIVVVAVVVVVQC